MTKFVIIGSGSHARVVSNTLAENGHNAYGMFGREEELPLQEIVTESLNSSFNGVFHIAVGENSVRERIEKDLLLPESYYFSVISMSSILDSKSQIGVGSFVGPMVYIGLNTIIGKHSIVNSGAKIDHDSRVGNFCHIAGNAYLSGKVSIGDRSFIGAGVNIIDGVSITSDVVVGAGATVIDSLIEAGTYVGTPARRIK